MSGVGGDINREAVHPARIAEVNPSMSPVSPDPTRPPTVLQRVPPQWCVHHDAVPRVSALLLAWWTQLGHDIGRLVTILAIKGAVVNISYPISDVIPSSHGHVLRVLANADVGLSVRAIAELTDGRVGRVQVGSVLQRLAAAGVVHQEHQPPAHVYRLNRDHIAADAVLELSSLRDSLITRIRARGEALDPPANAVWLFGSFARGDGGVGSDIDLLVIRSQELDGGDRVWLDAMSGFAADVQAWSGNPCNIIEYTSSELDDLITSGELLPVDIARDGIRLCGADIPRVAIRQASR